MKNERKNKRGLTKVSEIQRPVREGSGAAPCTTRNREPSQGATEGDVCTAGGGTVSTRAEGTF